MSLADEWHDPRGPEPLSLRVGNAQDAVEFVRKGFIRELDRRVLAAAEAAGLDVEQFARTLGIDTSQF